MTFLDNELIAPGHIHQAHFEEWVVGSGVDPKIAELNVRSLDDPREVDRLLNRNNNRRWKHWEHGPGWAVAGVDPQTGERIFAGAQFKPDTPVQRIENGNPKLKKDGSPDRQKYFSASDYETAPLFLDTGEPDYWPDVLTDITKLLLLGEGPKKAGASLSAGFACVSLAGVFNGQKKGRLKKSLEQFCGVGRRVVLAFDSDQMINIQVGKALDNLGKLLIERGCNVSVLVLPSETKGIDDYIVAYGYDAFSQLVSDALTFQEWRDLFYQPSLSRPQPTTGSEDAPKTWIDSLCQNHGLDPQNYVGLGTFDSHLFERLFEQGEGNWKVLDLNFHKYTDAGYWRVEEESKVHKLIARRAHQTFRIKQKKTGVEIDWPYMNQSHTDSAFKTNRKALLADEFIANGHLLCFHNCTVDLRTGESIPHDRAHLLTSAIAADYVPGAECPDDFKQFVAQAFGPEMLERVRAFLSWYVDPTAPLGYFLHILGPSGSGKGTFLRLLAKCFTDGGAKALSSFEPLSTPEGRHQVLSNCRFAYLPDIKGFVSGLGAFYELVDGGQLTGRALFSPVSYSKQWGTKFALASVDHLIVENMGDGWNRRVRYLQTKPLAHIDSEERKTLETRLENCLGQIIGWALAMPLAERDRLILSEEADEQLQLLRQDAATYGDAIRSFVDLTLRPAPDPKPLTTAELHLYFQRFCEVQGYSPAAMSKFASHLKTILPEFYVERRRSTVADGGVRRMIPASWRNLAPLEGVFKKFGEDPDDLAVRCLKLKCEEGGLFAFAEYLNPSPEDERGGNSGGGGDGHGGRPPLPTGGGYDSSQFGSVGAGLSNHRHHLPDPNQTTLLQYFPTLDQLDQAQIYQLEKNEQVSTIAVLERPEKSASRSLESPYPPDPTDPTEPNPARGIAAQIGFCQNWVAAVQLCERDGAKLRAAASSMSAEVHQYLTGLMSEHLVTIDPEQLEIELKALWSWLLWLPESLREEVLDKWRFRVIHTNPKALLGQNDLPLTVEVEGCRLVECQTINCGAKRESTNFFFQSPSGAQLTSSDGWFELIP